MRSLPLSLSLALLLATIGACNTFFDVDGARPSADDTQDDNAEGDVEEVDLALCEGFSCTDFPAAAAICCVVDGSPLCVDADNDTNHCGGCGVRCGVGEACMGGQCHCGDSVADGPFCAAGTYCCGSTCVADGQPCVCAGQVCGEDETCCFDACVDLQTNSDTCGDCYTSCGMDADCVAGECRCREAGKTFCFGACVDTSSDPDYCGDCDVSCNAFQTEEVSCNAGQCELTCVDGWANCDQNPSSGCETNLATDTSHCGGCGNFCGTENVTSSSCVNATCQLSCGSGGMPPLTASYGDCDGNPRNGCETLLNTVSHCGACHASCPTGAQCCPGGECRCGSAVDMCTGEICPGQGAFHSAASCSGMTCALTCAPGRANCDGDVGNSCETNTLTDPNNCGACHQACGTGGVCANGQCDEVVKVVAGGSHSCLLRASGKILCWGRNHLYQLGDGTNVSRNQPVIARIDGGTTYNAIDVAVGLNHTCAVLDDASVWCWGGNTAGESSPGAATQPVTPARKITAAGVNFTGIVAGLAHTCGLTDGGAVRCWGKNEKGQLGSGNFSPMTTLSTVTSLEGPAVAIVAGAEHTCAKVGTDPYYFSCWGSNSHGQCAEDPSVQDAFPSGRTIFEEVSLIAAGRNHTCAVFSLGFYCWGDNQRGQLGTNDVQALYAPGTPVHNWTSDTTVLTAGGDATCAADGFGKAFCWGDNFGGQLGIGTSGTGTHQSTPTAVLPGVGTPMVTVDRLSLGASHTCAREGSNKKIFCWGDATDGRLGTGTTGTAPVTSPREVVNVVP